MARPRARWALLVIVVFLLVLQQGWFVAHSKADNAASLLSLTPGITKLSQVGSSELLSAPSCNVTNINVVRNVLNNFVTNEEQHCLYTTLYGLTDGTIIQPNGFGKAYPINISMGGSPFLKPIANQESMLFEIGDRSFPGVDVGLYKNFYQHLHFNNFYQRFDLSDSPDVFFRYSDGRQISFNTVNFSSNGQYILADMPHQGFVKINLATLTMKPVAGALPLINNNGLLGAATTIDNEGRYAAIAYAAPGGWGDPFLQIIDTDSCDDAMPATAYDSLNLHCVSVDDFSWLKQKISALQSAQGVSFSSQDTLLFDAALADGTFARYALSPNGLPASLEQYLAMGDSYIAGEGAFSYRDGTDTEENKCHQSTLSYPYLLGVKHFDSFESVACSGALIRNVVGDDNSETTYQISGGKIKPTNAERELAIERHLPGILAQKDFIGQDNPKVVTISIGGNDIGFTDIIKRCIIPFNNGSSVSQNCYQTYEDRLELVNTINNQYQNLISTYRAVVNKDPTRRVYVIGYPQVVSPTGECGINVRLSQSDRLLAYQLTDYLDSVIEQAAKKAGVFYVDTQQALVGHRLCEDGIKAVNGLTAGNDKFNLIGNESYHPNALGQELLGDAIASATHNLTAPMPTANTNIPNPTSSDLLDILQAPKTSRVVYETLNVVQDVEQVIDAGSSVNISINQFEGLLAPAAAFNGVLHSTPTGIGTYHTDAAGKLSGTVTIPTGTKPGFHTLHFYGKDIAGNPVDVQQTVYVRASENDSDGDGVADVADSCSYIPNSGIDVDQDDIDDVCDVEIGFVSSTQIYNDTTEPKSNSPQSVPVNPQRPLLANALSSASLLPGNTDVETIGGGTQSIGQQTASVLGVNSVDQHANPGPSSNKSYQSGAKKLVIGLLAVGILGALTWWQVRRKAA